MRRSTLLVPLALLAACAVGPSREQILAQFVGADESQLIRGLGVPSRTYVTGQSKFLAYDQQRTEVLPSPVGPWGYGYGWFDPFPPDVVTYGCETTFEIVAGRVRSFNLRGNACG